jgi:hypothetical protein
MAKSVFAILEDLGTNLSELKNALAPLASLTGGDGLFPAKRGRAKAVKSSGRRGAQRKPAAAQTRVKRRRKPVSAAVKAKRVLQGRYLGAIRPLTKAQRTKVKKIQAAKGHVAAIKAAGAIAR